MARKRNITFSMVIVALPQENYELGMVINMAHTTDMDKHLAVHKLDHLIPCDGRPVDRDKFPDLYRMMENALVPGSPVTVPNLTHEQEVVSIL